ncbi:MAG TPA: phosphoribosylanthranilate isomerase [Caproiciproducens sp.]|nr:phosphoribosylanthranilate isomerase [Caproiciproducens sp.]
MTKVKICGLTRMEDILAANQFHPDYIGFVFAKSRRQVDADTARKLKSALDGGIKAVGIFVNEEINAIASLVQAGILDAVQLHGNEDEGYIASLRAKISVPIIKAVSVRSREQILSASCLPCDYLLLDTYVPGEQGGSGKSFDWSVIPPIKKPYFLAGGLDCRNVADAIKILHPYCVDVSSGVETDGLKDSGKMAEFISKVRSMI